MGWFLLFVIYFEKEKFKIVLCFVYSRAVVPNEGTDSAERNDSAALGSEVNPTYPPSSVPHLDTGKSGCQHKSTLIPGHKKYYITTWSKFVFRMYVMLGITAVEVFQYRGITDEADALC